MCLILFALEPDDRYRLVLAANRDEFYQRPSRAAGFWEEQPGLLAGKDLQAGGTWLGVTRTGRFAAVTNFREDPPSPLPPGSRGELTTGFLTTSLNPDTYLGSLAGREDHYRGFNLLVGTLESFHYYSNRGQAPRRLSPGVYGLANQLLDCDWPKVADGRRGLLRILSGGADPEALFALLAERGDDTPWSHKFISTATYGTCASTVVLLDRNGTCRFEERVFGVEGQPLGRRVFEFQIEAPAHTAPGHAGPAAGRG